MVMKQVTVLLDFVHLNIPAENKITKPRLIEIWNLAISIGNKYNGKDGRYVNEAISAGGLDFSDLAEVCWILGYKTLRILNISLIFMDIKKW